MAQPNPDLYLVEIMWHINKCPQALMNSNNPVKSSSLEKENILDIMWYLFNVKSCFLMLKNC